MNKLILLALVCTGFAVTTPFTAHALDSEKVGQNLDARNREGIAQANAPLPLAEPNMSLAEPLLGTRHFVLATPALCAYGTRIAQYNQNRDRQFSVYYRNRGNRQWTLEGYHNNRRDARQAANRLERRGYRTYIQVSRRINSGMNRG